MPRRGRKPAPRTLKIAGRAGEEAAGSLATHEPVAKSKLAAEEWERMLRELPGGILSPADSAALAAYCDAYATWVLASRDVRENGLLAETAFGGAKPNPCVQIAKDARKQMLQFLAEFGATPSARARLKTTENHVDPLDEFLAG